MSIAESFAGQKVALECRFTHADTDGSGDISSAFCADLAQYLSADLGLAVSPGNGPGPGHRISVEMVPRSQQAFGLAITTAPLRGGAQTTVKSVLVSRDGKITGFAARTLVRPIAIQLGMDD